MPGPTTEFLSADFETIRADFKDLARTVHGLDVGLGKLQTEFALAKWLLGVLLVATLSGIGSGIWWASAISHRVGTLENRFDRPETRFDRLETRFDRLDARSEKTDAMLAKILEQTKPKP